MKTRDEIVEYGMTQWAETDDDGLRRVIAVLVQGNAELAERLDEIIRRLPDPDFEVKGPIDLEHPTVSGKLASDVHEGAPPMDPRTAHIPYASPVFPTRPIGTPVDIECPEPLAAALRKADAHHAGHHAGPLTPTKEDPCGERPKDWGLREFPLAGHRSPTLDGLGEHAPKTASQVDRLPIYKVLNYEIILDLTDKDLAHLAAMRNDVSGHLRGQWLADRIHAEIKRIGYVTSTGKAKMPDAGVEEKHAPPTDKAWFAKPIPAAKMCRGPQHENDPKPGEPDVGLAVMSIGRALRTLEGCEHPLKVEGLLLQALRVLQPPKPEEPPQ